MLYLKKLCLLFISSFSMVSNIFVNIPSLIKIVRKGICCNLSMKEGSLFCFVDIRFTEPGCFRSCSWCLWKALNEEGWMGLVS
jgi:hypothetical protein